MPRRECNHEFLPLERGSTRRLSVTLRPRIEHSARGMLASASQGEGQGEGLFE